MKKIGEFTTQMGLVCLHTNDWEMALSKGIPIESGRWEIWVDNENKANAIVLKAKFQVPSSEPGEGSSFFQGGKL